MTTLRKAAQQALEALESCDSAHPSDGGKQWYDDKLVEPAITALRAALAEPVQEPVAWVRALPDGRLDRLSVVAYDDEAEEMLQRSIAGCTLVPLFAAPPQRKPLTREEAIALWADKSDGPSVREIVSFARAVERAHGITGETA